MIERGRGEGGGENGEGRPGWEGRGFKIKINIKRNMKREREHTYISLRALLCHFLQT